MDDGELGCVSRCAEKYLKLTSRAGFRFAEFQSQSAQVCWSVCVCVCILSCVCLGWLIGWGFYQYLVRSCLHAISD
jgi:hypothetical protein